MFKNKLFILILGLLAFINIYYEINPFVFNATTNNIEELPFIYKLIGLAPYPYDEYVKLHTEHFTQVTPYILLITFIAKIFNLHDLTILFFILHAITISIFYLSIRQLYKCISDVPESLVIISIFCLNLFLRIIYVIPNNRTLFYDFLDPEFLTYPFLLFTIAFHIKKERPLAFFSLLAASVLHPLYALPLLPALILSELKNFKTHFLYLLAVLPYTIFLWLESRQTINSDINTSMTLEIIRAPHHYRIPNLEHFDYSILIFYLFSISLLIISFLVLKKKSPESEYLAIVKINSFLIALLLLTSAVSSFIRIPILIQLTPYRIGVIIVILSWVLFCYTLFKSLNVLNIFMKRFDLALISFLLLISLLMTLKENGLTTSENKNFSIRKDVISWIKNNTSKNDLFLNYSDLDIRTETLRSDYFGFQTSPLTANGQIAWYKQFLVYYDVPTSIPPTNYKESKEFASSSHNINISTVLKRSKAPINYIVLLKNKKPFSKVTELVNLSNRNYNYITKDLNLVFENESYRIYKPKS